MDYVEVRAGLSISRNAEGTTWTEKRIYDSSDLEAVLAALPPKYAAHPSIPFASLLDASVALVEAKDKSIATLNYGPRTTTQNTRPATNSAGEVWEWMMVSQMMHITSVVGLSEWDGVPHVLEWNNLNVPPRVAAEGPEISPGIRKGDNGSFEGLEVYRPTGALRVSKTFDNIDDVNSTFRQTIYSLEAKVNRAEWVDWGPQEVLFLGASIRKGTDSASIDYNFLFGRKEVGVKFKIMKLSSAEEAMDEITVSEVFPFQAVWQEASEKNYRPTAGENGQSKKPIQAINLKIADVYDLADFDLLGLTSPEEPPFSGGVF